MNLLKRREGEESRVLADAFSEASPEEAEEAGWEHEGYFRFSLESLGAEYPKGVAAGEDHSASEDDFIDEHAGTEEEDSLNVGPENQAYGRIVVTGTGDAWLQYWLYYYFNPGVETFDEHEGDWEMVQVRLSKLAGYLPDEVVFNHHSRASRCVRGEFHTHGNHTIVYSAADSHASYPEEGLYETDVPEVYETVTAIPSEIPPATIGVVSEPTEWLNWPGRWGASGGSSPVGPAFGSHETAFEEPETYAEEAEDCYATRIFPRAERASMRPPFLREEEPLELIDAQLTGSHISVGYRTSGIHPKGEEAPVLLLAVDSLQDKRPPRLYRVEDVKSDDTVELPFNLNPSKKWRVRGTLQNKEGRTPTVVIGARTG